MLALLLLACRLSNHPVASWETGPTVAAPQVSALSAPGPIHLETLVAARWEVSNKGLIDLDDPKTQAAGIAKEKVPIVLLAHILRHPTRGDFLVDTGVALDEGGRLEMLAGLAAKVVAPEQMVDLSEALTARGVSLNGVFMTHMHIDHILGLSDIAAGVPILVGPANKASIDALHALVDPIEGLRVVVGHEQ